MNASLRREAIGATLLFVVLTGAASADPWRQGEPRGPATPRQVQTAPATERNEPGPAFGGSPRVVRPSISETTLPRTAAAPRAQGTTRAVDARGEPTIVRLGFQHMTQVQFAGDIQQVITAFTKQQISMETTGSRLFLSALEPDLSGELFVTLAGGSTLTLIVVSATGTERDLAQLPHFQGRSVVVSRSCTRLW